MGRKKEKPAPINNSILNPLMKKAGEIVKEKDNRTFLTIDGKKVTVRNFMIFETYCRTGSFVETAKLVGMTPAGLYSMKEKDWWKKLEVDYLNSKQDKLHRELAESVSTAVESIKQIWDGSFAEPKLAMAVVKSVELFAKMGKSHGKHYAEPLIQNKKDLFVDNSVHNEKHLHIDISKYLPEMTPQEIDDYAHGELPKWIKQKALVMDLDADPDYDEL